MKQDSDMLKDLKRIPFCGTVAEFVSIERIFRLLRLQYTIIFLLRGRQFREKNASRLKFRIAPPSLYRNGGGKNNKNSRKRRSKFTKNKRGEFTNEERNCLQIQSEIFFRDLHVKKGRAAQLLLSRHFS